MSKGYMWISQKFKENIRMYTAVFLLYAAGILALIQADFPYKDDLRRTLNGNMWWDRQSRYLSNLIAGLLSMDTHIGNLSPLTQLLGAAVMAAGAMMLIRLFYKGKKNSPLVFFALVPFALSPYFLECFSFQFDIPFMAVSVVACIFPFLLIPVDFREMDPKQYAAASFLGVLVMLLTYQASSGIYPMIAAFLFLKWWNRGLGSAKERIRFVLLSAGSYLAALVFYMAVLLHPYKNYKSIEMLPLRELIPGAFLNYLHFYYRVYADFKPLWLVLFLAGVVLFWTQTVLGSSQKKWHSFLVTGAVLAFASAMAYGIYLAMKEAAFNPRMMYGFGVLLTVLFLQMVSASNGSMEKQVSVSSKTLRMAGAAVCVLLGWCFFSFGFLYGNALAEQKRFQELSMSRVISALDTVEVMKSDTVKTMQLEGDFGISPAVRDMEQGYSMLSRLVPSSKADYQWTKYYFFGYLGLSNVKPAKAKEDFAALNLPVLADTAYCTVRGDDERILVTIREQDIEDLM